MASKEKLSTLLFLYKESLEKALAAGDRDTDPTDARGTCLAHGRDLMVRTTRRQSKETISPEEESLQVSLTRETILAIALTSGFAPFARDVAQVAGAILATLLLSQCPSEQEWTWNLLIRPSEDILSRYALVDPNGELAPHATLLTLPICRGLIYNIPFPQLILPATIRMPSSPEGILLLELLRDAAFDRCEKTSSLNARVVGYEALAAALVRAKQDLPKTSPALQHHLVDTTFALHFQDRLLQIIWDNCSNAEEVVQHKVHELFQKYLLFLITAERLLAATPAFSPRSPQFLLACWSHFTALEWTMKIKYVLLEDIVPHMPLTSLLDPILLEDPIKGLASQTLASRSAKVLVALFSRHAGRLAPKDEEVLISATPALPFWITRVAALLMDKDTLVNRHTGIYLLPSLLEQVPSITFALLPLLQAPSTAPASVDLSSSSEKHPLRAVMTVLQAARALGICDDEARLQQYRVYDILHVASYDVDDELRIDALRFVVEQKRSTKPFSSQEFAFLRAYLKYNINSGSPYFRQKVYKSVSKVIARLHSSITVIRRELEGARRRAPPTAGIPADTEDPRIAEAISFARFLISDLCLSECFFPGAQHARIITGLCIIEHIFVLGGHPPLDDLIHVALTSSLHTPASSHLLIALLRNPYEDVRQMSSRLLASPIFPSPLPGYAQDDAYVRLLQRGVSLCGSIRAGDAETGALLVELFLRKYTGSDVDMAMILSSLGQSPSSTSLGSPAEGLVTGLVQILEERVAVAEQDLLKASLQLPLHGTLHALERCILASGSTSALPLPRILTLCLRVIASVHSVLSDESPEGNWILSEGAEVEDLFRDAGPKHQVLSSFCWRAIKGSSGVIQALLPLLPAKDLPTIASLAPRLHATLLELRHRGAFSHLVPAFQVTCRTLVGVNAALYPDLAAQPSKMLTSTIALISAYHVSVTRRSAALPWAIVSILEVLGQSEMTCVIAELIDISATPFAPGGKGEEEDLPQVHALNSLRVLFSHSTFVTRTTPHLESVLILTLRSFASRSWAIRNCALMCYSTLMARVFGRKHIQKEGVEVENTLTTREFFNKYPRLLDVLVEGLKGQEGAKSGHLGHHPILTILASLDTANPDARLSRRLQPLVAESRALLLSPAMYVRNMAAKAYIALLPKETLGDHVLSLLVEAVSPGKTGNEVHGILVALRAAILKASVAEAERVLSDVGSVLWARTHEEPLPPFLSALMVECTLLCISRSKSADLTHQVSAGAVADLLALAASEAATHVDYTQVGWDRWVEQLVRVSFIRLSPKAAISLLRITHPFILSMILRELLKTVDSTENSLFRVDEALRAAVVTSTLQIASSSQVPSEVTLAVRILASLLFLELGTTHVAFASLKEDLTPVLANATAHRVSPYFLLPIQGAVYGENVLVPESVAWVETLYTFTQPDQLPISREYAARGLVAFLRQVSTNEGIELLEKLPTMDAIPLLDAIVTLLQDDDEEVRLEMSSAFRDDKMHPCPDYALLRCFRLFTSALPAYQVVIQGRAPPAEETFLEQAEDKVLFFEEPTNTYAEHVVVLNILEEVIGQKE